MYSVELMDDPNSQVGVLESLTEILLNETTPSWNQSNLNIPALSMDLGLYKLVFRLEVSIAAIARTCM